MPKIPSNLNKIAPVVVLSTVCILGIKTMQSVDNDIRQQTKKHQRGEFLFISSNTKSNDNPFDFS